VGITEFLSDSYYCFVELRNWVSIFFIFHWILYWIFSVFEESSFHPFFFPSLHLMLCLYIFGRLVGGFDCQISLPDLIFLLWLIWFLARLTWSFLPWSWDVI
jgi:hypothetical protein